MSTEHFFGRAESLRGKAEGGHFDRTYMTKFAETSRRHGSSYAVAQAVYNIVGVPTYVTKRGTRVQLNLAGMARAYMLMDRMTKLATFKDLKDQGFSGREAVEKINRYFDYSAVPRWIKKSRPYLAFATFPYLTARGMTYTMEENPARAAVLMAFFSQAMPQWSLNRWFDDFPDDHDLSYYDWAQENASFTYPGLGKTGKWMDRSGMVYMGKDEETGHPRWLHTHKWNPFMAPADKVREWGKIFSAMTQGEQTLSLIHI